MDTNINELNLEQMDEISGGAYGGSAKPLAAKAGYEVYRILPNDTLSKIARKFKTTVDKIKAANPSITNVNQIRAGFYIYVPKA